MLLGTKIGTLHDTEIYDVHGQTMCKLIYYLKDTPEVAREARMAPESMYPNPERGDAIAISFAAGVAIDVKKQS